MEYVNCLFFYYLPVIWTKNKFLVCVCWIKEPGVDAFKKYFSVLT